jgi:hypothetical protein
MNEIVIAIGSHRFEADVLDTPTGRAILEILPVETSINTWGDEIYFHVPAQASLEPGARTEVNVGDLAYWPTMPAFCIFFGPTPASLSGTPRAASNVNVFGYLKKIDLKELQSLTDGMAVRVSRLFRKQR